MYIYAFLKLPMLLEISRSIPIREVVWIAVDNGYFVHDCVPAVCVRHMGVEIFRDVFVVYQGVPSPFLLGYLQTEPTQTETVKKKHLICMYSDHFLTQQHCLVRFVVFMLPIELKWYYAKPQHKRNIN